MGRRETTARLTNELWTTRQEVASIKRYCDSLFTEHAPHFQACDGGVHCQQHENKIKKKSLTLREQAKYVAHMENELRALQDKYEAQISKIKLTAMVLEKELVNVRSELKRIVSKAESADKLAEEVQYLRDKVKRRDKTIDRYESKYGRICNMIKSIKTKCDGNQQKKETGDGKHHSVINKNHNNINNGCHRKSPSNSSESNKTINEDNKRNKIASNAVYVPKFAQLPAALEHIAQNKLKVEKVIKRSL